jgi:hypothetical protein
MRGDSRWRDWVPGGPSRNGGSAEEWRLRLENGQTEDGAGGGDGAAADATEGRRVRRSGPFGDLEALRAAAVCRFRGSPASRGSRVAPITAAWLGLATVSR